MVTRLSEALGVSPQEVFELAAVGDTSRNAGRAYEIWLLSGELPLWFLNFARKVLYEKREETLSRTEE